MFSVSGRKTQMEKNGVEAISGMTILFLCSYFIGLFLYITIHLLFMCGNVGSGRLFDQLNVALRCVRESGGDPAQAKIIYHNITYDVIASLSPPLLIVIVVYRIISCNNKINRKHMSLLLTLLFVFKLGIVLYIILQTISIALMYEYILHYDPYKAIDFGQAIYLLNCIECYFLVLLLIICICVRMMVKRESIGG